MYTWAKYNALPISIRDGVEAFWEPGYDYSNADLWTSFDPAPSEEFIEAVKAFDYLMKTDPDGH